jgi:two-component system, sensor histidine kinase and response regulator
VKSGQVPVRLLAEIIAIMALLEAGLMLWLPRVLPAPMGSSAALMNAGLLVLLAAPTLYWRCMRATRRAGLQAVARQAGGPATESELPAATLAGGAQRRRRAAVVMTALTQLAGLALTAAAMRWTATSIEDEARSRFERHVERLQTEVQRRFNQPVYGLMGARGAYAASGRIDRESLAAYTGSRDLPREFPGVLGFGFIERVERTRLDAFVQRTRAELGPDFQVRSGGEADDLYVIKYIEPLAENVNVRGVDLGSETVRREAIERAIDTGEATLTGQIRLMQAQHENHGFLYLVPLYRHGSDAGTGAQRRRMLIGLVYAPIYADDLLAGVPAVTDHAVDVELFDGDGMHVQQLVFDSDNHLARHAGAVSEAHYAQRLFATARSLQVGGRLLTLRASTTPSFEAGVDRSAIAHIGFGGAMLSCLLALAVWSLAAGRVRALSLAQRMTADLDRLAQVVRHTQNAVTITDRDLCITWINEGFTRITGYTLAEAAGKTPGELLGSGEADPEVLRRLASSAAAGRSCRVEILNRRKDGRTYWLDTEIQPLHDAQGLLNGFMEIGSDITDKREATARLQAALRENDSLLGVIQQHAIVAASDPQGRITDANDAYCRISGFRRDELIGRHHLMVDTGLDTDEFRRVVAPLLQAGQAWRGELCNRAKDGSLYWVDTAIAPFFDASGRIERFVTIRHDITARETAARELARERERLDNILRGTHGGTWEWNVQTGETLIDERWAEIIGHSVAELAPVTVDTFRDRLHPDDAKRSAELLVRHFDGEIDYYDCEVRMRHRDGHWVWVHSRGRVSDRDGAGGPLWMAGTHMDISARKQAESRLADSEHLMRLVTENVPGRLAYFDAQRRLGFANKAAVESFGGALDELLGRPFDEFLGPTRTAAFSGKAALALRGEPQTYDVEKLDADGQPSYIIVHLVPDEREGAVRGFVAMTTDVTHVKRAEREMQRAEALLRGAIDAVNEAFVLFDADDRMVFCNDKYREIYASAPDLIQPGNSFEHILREGVRRGLIAVGAGQVDEWMADRLAAHRQGVTQVQRLADGRWLRLIERRMPDGHTVGFRIDITDLVNATEAAEAASQAKSRFLANTSHEIRTPMNAVLGMLRLLRNTDMTMRQRDYAEKAERAARALLALLNDILDFSKVEAGKLELDRRPFEVASLLRDLSVILSANLADKPVALRFDIDPALPPRLVGDDLRLQQVLLNLAGNAIKFTERGEVVVRLKLAMANVTDALVDFSVCDTGIGIAPEHQQHIFDGFAQAEASTTRRFGGTGLGLSICQRLVALMGGRIALDSEPGRGSCFAFTLALPLAETGEEAPPGTDHRPAPPGQRLAGLRLLVVEDNPINQEVARDLLRDEGASVTLAGDGRQGIAAVVAADPCFDAVLMDVQMPVMDGHAAASHLRRELGLATLPIIAMTANAMPSDRAASLASGMNDHIGKPFDLDELVAVLHRHVPVRPAPPAPVPRRRAFSSPVVTPEVRGLAQAAGFDLDAALQRLAGRVDVYLRLAASFDERLATLPADLAAVLHADRRAEAERLAHTIKGVAATLGALRLAAMAGEVERALQHWPPKPPQADWKPRWESAVQAARTALAELLPRLKAQSATAAGPQAILGDMSVSTPAVSDTVSATVGATVGATSSGSSATASIGTGSTTPAQAETLRRGLQTLASLLANADMAATDRFADLALSPGNGWRQQLEPLAAPMAALDFPAALSVCRAILARLDQPADAAHADEGMPR